MRAKDKFKYGGAGAATMVVATALLLTTGWGRAAAATVTSVFVTNKGATQAIPVQQQGTANTNVTNKGATQAVPTHEQGTANTNVTNHGFFQAIPTLEQGTPSVSVLGTPNVNVTNGTLNVHEQGTANVSGTVSTLPAGSTPWNAFVNPTAPGLYPLFRSNLAPPGTTHLAITSLTVADVNSPTTGSEGVLLDLWSDPNCASGSHIATIDAVVVNARVTVSQTFPQPLIQPLSNGVTNWCISYSSSNTGIWITAVGYSY